MACSTPRCKGSEKSPLRCRAECCPRGSLEPPLGEQWTEARKQIPASLQISVSLGLIPKPATVEPECHPLSKLTSWAGEGVGKRCGRGTCTLLFLLHWGSWWARVHAALLVPFIDSWKNGLGLPTQFSLDWTGLGWLEPACVQPSPHPCSFHRAMLSGLLVN